MKGELIMKDKPVKSPMKLHFLNKEVQLFPTDTYYKFGIVEEINEYGIVIKITKAHKESGYRAGQRVYFSHSCSLKLVTV
jgi:hypothetical protein